MTTTRLPTGTTKTPRTTRTTKRTTETPHPAGGSTRTPQLLVIPPSLPPDSLDPESELSSVPSTPFSVVEPPTPDAGPSTATSVPSTATSLAIVADLPPIVAEPASPNPAVAELAIAVTDTELLADTEPSAATELSAATKPSTATGPSTDTEPSAVTVAVAVTGGFPSHSDADSPSGSYFDYDTHSSSSSDSEVSYSHPPLCPMAEQPGGLAFIQQSSSKVPPILTPGIITPEILHQWERACLNYFRHRRIGPSVQVEDVLFEVKDLRLSRWIEAREESLKDLSFSAFMSELRDEALDPNWARMLRTEILRTRQDDRPFFDWVCEVECKNAILAPVSSARISDQQLRDHFEAQMDVALAQRCQKSSIVSIVEYRSWTNAVKQEDKLLRQDLENARSVSLGVLAENSRQRSGTAIGSSARSNPSSSVPVPPSSSTMPKLTEEEKRILGDHDGCFRCRRLFAGHRTRECPNGFPEKHVRITTAMAEAARDERNRVSPRRAAGALAAVTLTDDGDLPAAVLGYGSGESASDSE